MAHREQLQTVEHVRTMFPASFQGARVLEIGSLDINGGIRRFFRNCDYTGLDVGPGPGVDVVCQGQDYAAPDGSFDTVVSCEVMEHNPHWRETLRNMLRMCRPGGLVLMTCASTGRKEHGTTRTLPGESPLTVGLGWDYYRNLSTRDIHDTLDVRSEFSAFGLYRNWYSADLILIGFRAGLPSPRDAKRQLGVMGLNHALRNMKTLCGWIVRRDTNRLGILLHGEPV
jgi:SAM-dependent methyltransferase